MVTWLDPVFDYNIQYSPDEYGWILSSWPYPCVQCRRPTYYAEINYGCFMHRSCENRFLLPLMEEDANGVLKRV